MEKISVNTPLGVLTACIGGDPKFYPEIFVYLQREDGSYRQEFFDLVNDYEKRLKYAKENTDLPATPNMKRVEEFVGEKQFMRLLDIRMADILAHRKDTQESRIERCAALGMMASEVIEQNQCFKLKDLVIDGYDIMNLCDVKEGKDVGRILNEVLDAVINGNLENERPAIIKHLIMKGWCSNE